MSFMTTNMFAPRIWGFDLSRQEIQIARQAGWRRSDVLWEGLMEAANKAWRDNNPRQAARFFRRAGWVARFAFEKNDLRHATVAVNRAVMDNANGKTKRAAAQFDKARSHWQMETDNALRNMKILPRSRSSLFHLRMEALHRETFHDNMRHRIGMIADETLQVINDLSCGSKPKHRMFTRWIGEKPNVYDDTRIILGACLLIVE